MKIVVYPWDKNPYQTLLYDALQRQQPGVTVLRKLWRFPYIWWAIFPLVLVICRVAGYRILHMHWWHFLSVWGGPKGSFRYSLNALSYAFHIWLIKCLGYRVVWTVHNVMPHEQQTADDKQLMRRLSQLSNAKIVHSSYGLQQLKEQGLDTINTTVIPHGNYAGVYPVTVTRQQARRQLGISADARVVLFLGKIRGYKGIDDLLAAYAGMQTTHTRLVIVGQPDDQVVHQAIAEAAKTMPIQYIPGHVADADIAQYYMAADVVCLPFKAVTTSGSALLALTFGKPLIAPRAGALLDVPEAAGYFYDPSKKDALATQLKQAVTAQPADIARRSEAAVTYADTLDWDAIAAKTYTVYRQVLTRK